MGNPLSEAPSISKDRLTEITGFQNSTELGDVAVRKSDDGVEISVVQKREPIMMTLRGVTFPVDNDLRTYIELDSDGQQTKAFSGISGVGAPSPFVDLKQVDNAITNFRKNFRKNS